MRLVCKSEWAIFEIHLTLPVWAIFKLTPFGALPTGDAVEYSSLSARQLLGLCGKVLVIEAHA